MDSHTSKELLTRYRAGDGPAAGAIFDRYLVRLIELARRRISPRLAQRIDPEDIVQSAYRSFFVHARDGQFVLQRAGDLWRLLAGITLNKLHGQIERHTAARRNIGRESYAAPDGSQPSAADPAAPEPTPDEAAAVAEQLHLFMQRLSPTERRVLELRLQGQTIDEIAATVDCSQRTVRRMIETAHDTLARELRG
ncbi:MAG: sigma-70 family RNA polymerase sigma factor [Planctomycetia bacterium]|nr:sigma-70 family RNA polymerase sigma factor [Planctomycetia bacterium]